MLVKLEMVMEFLHILKYIPLTKNCALLIQVQKCLTQYTPCMTVGQLASGGRYTYVEPFQRVLDVLISVMILLLTINVLIECCFCSFSSHYSMNRPHAYVVLMDSKWFSCRLNKQLYKSKLPCIVIETTAYTQSTWSNSTIQGDAKTDALYHMQCRLSATSTFQNAEDQYDRSIKWKIPTSIVNKENKYGKVFALLTSDYYNETLDEFESMHLLVSMNDNSRRLGVDHLQLATYNNDIHFTIANRLNKESVQQLNQEMKNLPFSHFPKAPNAQDVTIVQNNNNKQCLIFDIRYVDWLEHEQTLTTMFKELLQLLDRTKIWDIIKQVIAVSDDCKLVQISIVEK